MTAAQQRKALRTVHLITGVALVAYVYLPAPAELRDVIRFLILPVLVLTGMSMWQAPRLRRLARPRLVGTRQARSQRRPPQTAGTRG